MIRNNTKNFLIILIVVFITVFFVSKDKIFENFLYKNYIQSSAKEFNVDPVLILSVIKEESRFKNTAISNVGAIGLMQLMPKTSKEIAQRLKVKNFSLEMLKNPEINIRFGAYYLQKLIAKYDGNLILALAAYNAGIGIVDGWIEGENENAIKDFELENIRYKSTKIFARKVLRNYKFLKKLNKFLGIV